MNRLRSALNAVASKIREADPSVLDFNNLILYFRLLHVRTCPPCHIILPSVVTLTETYLIVRYVTLPHRRPLCQVLQRGSLHSSQLYTICIPYIPALYLGNRRVRGLHPILALYVLIAMGTWFPILRNTTQHLPPHSGPGLHTQCSCCHSTS